MKQINYRNLADTNFKYGENPLAPCDSAEGKLPFGRFPERLGLGRGVKTAENL